MKNTKHIIVTGGAGFIGSHIALGLVSRGYAVTVLDNLSTGNEENIPKGVNFIKIDLSIEDSYSSLNNICCDAIFHLAGQSSGETSFIDPVYDLRSHVMSTFFLLDWCRKKGVKRFLYSSSMSIYGEPNYLPVDENHSLQPKTFYAAAKISSEAYIKLYQSLGINTTIFRLFSVYGPGQNLGNKIQGMVSIYLSYMLENVPIQVRGSKERFRDFIYIDDVVDAWMASLDNPIAHGKIYNLATGKKVKIEELLGMLKSLYGDQNYPIEYKDGTPGDQFGIVADIKLIQRDLNWSHKVDLKTGLDKMLRYYQKKINIK